MTQFCLSTFDEWKKKCCDAALSKDPLVPVLSSSFNVISAVLEDSDRSLIQRALGSLDFERSQSLALENITEPSLRCLLYGHCECLHMTLFHMVEGRNQSRSSEFLSAVDEWKKKCCDSNLQYDALIPVLSRSFDVMSVILKDSVHSLIQRKLVSLGFERSQFLNMENIVEPSLRSLIYGLFECLYMAFEFLFDDNNHSIPSEESGTQSDEIPSQIDLDSLVSSLNSSNLISNHSLGLLSTSFEHEDCDPMDDDLIDEEKDTQSDEVYGSLEVMEDEMPFNEISEEREDDSENEVEKEKEPSETIPAEMLGMLSIGMSTSPRYAESSEDSDEEEVTSVNISKSKSEKKTADDTPKCILCEVFPSTMRGYTEHLKTHHKSTLIMNRIFLQCECDYEVSSQRSLVSHNECNERLFTLHKLNEKDNLRNYTPKCILCENGIFLRCECDYEIRSETRSSAEHNKACDGRQFTVHKVNEKSNPKIHFTKCVLCEKFPSTVIGYTQHLKDVHKSTLKENGVYLKCSCSFEVRSDKSHNNHDKKCGGRQFSLQKLRLNENPKCILCEKFPSTASGYAQHLNTHHKSTLKDNGIYLKCSCFLEVRSYNSHSNHNKKCDGRQFTLHKIDEN